MRFAMKAAPVLCKRVSTQSRGAYGLTESLCPHTDMPQVSVASSCRTERPAVIPRPSGQRTGRMLGFLAIALGFTGLVHTSHAQVSIPHDVDTLTSGDSDHLNPSMQHNAFWGPAAKWVVYEHVEGGLTSIRGLQIDWDRLSWDTRVFSISGEYPQGMVRSAEVAGMAFTPVTQWVAAWEQQTDGHWSIWYSTRSDTGNAWSPPQDLTPDTVDNTGIKLRPISGYVLATWRRGNDLLACRIGPSGPIDAMEVGRSTSNNFEYDVLIVDRSGRIHLGGTGLDRERSDLLSVLQLRVSTRASVDQDGEHSNPSFATKSLVRNAAILFRWSAHHRIRVRQSWTKSGFHILSACLSRGSFG